MQKKTIVIRVKFFIVTFVLLISSSVSNAQTVISPSDPNIQYIGRFDMTNPCAPRIGLAGTEIRAKFKGKTISAILSGDAAYFNFIIDDRMSYFCFSGEGDVICPLAIELRDTIHTISIIKRGSPWNSQVFKGFILDNGKSLTDPPARNSRRIEFYGDSMTQGAQADVPGTGPDLREIVYDNNYNSYATMVARAFNAECSIVAMNGMTLVQAQGKPDLPSVYDRVSCSVRFPKWDFEKWKADVVVVNLGANDNPFPSNFTSVYIDFVKKIRAKYHDAHIFLLAGPMKISMDEAHCNAISEVVKELNDKHDDKVHFYKFKNPVEHPGHNRIADNIISSEELVAEIKRFIW